MKYNVTEQQSQFLQTLNLQPSGYRCFDLDAEQLKATIDALVERKSTSTGGQKRIISTLLKKFGITGGFTKRIRSGYFTENNYIARLNYLAEMASINPVTFSVAEDGNLDCSAWSDLTQSVLDQIEKAAELKMIPGDVSRILNDNFNIHASSRSTTVESLRQQEALNASLTAAQEAVSASTQGELFPEPEPAPEPLLAPLPVVTAPMIIEPAPEPAPVAVSWLDEEPTQQELDEIEASNAEEDWGDEPSAPEAEVEIEEPEFVGLEEIYDDEEEDDEDDADDFGGDSFTVTQAIRCGVFNSTLSNLGWDRDGDNVIDEDEDLVGRIEVEGYTYTFTFADSANAEAYADECKCEIESAFMDRDMDEDDENDVRRVTEECDAILEAY
jgi:hypothetical protein